LVVLVTADVLIMFDSMVVTVALPSIEQSLGFSTIALQWVVTAYMLGLAAFLLVGGRAADLCGRRRVLRAGLTAFAAASILAAIAWTPAVLLAARALQGIGAALAVSAALALLTASIDEERRRRRALGVLAAGIFGGMVAGLVLGGVITTFVGWPWVFVVVVPFAALAVALAPHVLPESRDEQAGSPDLLGALLAAPALAMLVFGVVQIEHHGLVAFQPLASLLGASALLAGFVAVEKRVEAPLVRLEIFRHRPLRAANLGIAANAGGFSALIFLTTLYMQKILGFSPLLAGLGFIPLAVTAATGALLASPLVERLGARRLTAASLAITAASFAFLSRLGHDDHYLPSLLPAFAVAGLSFAAAYVPLTQAAIDGLPEAEKGLASGVYQTSTHLGGAVLVAVVATLAVSQSSGPRSPEALTDGFAVAFIVGAAVLASAAVASAWLLPSGEHRSGTDSE
jgi:EmrB/QacA subfamily drug resistance transporter